MKLLWIWPDWQFGVGHAIPFRYRHVICIGPLVVYCGRVSDTEFRAFWEERNAKTRELIDSIQWENTNDNLDHR